MAEPTFPDLRAFLDQLRRDGYLVTVEAPVDARLEASEIHRRVIAASRGGKLKTLLQMIAISLYLLPGPFGLARPIVMGLAVAVTLVTGADYVLQAARLGRSAPQGGS